jgi:hypothetical protein
MGDIDNGIHELLVATAEPDEEANRRCRQRIWIVFSLVLGAIDAVLLLMFLYYGLKDDSGIIPLWAIAFVFGIFCLRLPSSLAQAHRCLFCLQSHRGTAS